jgi:hypothetical protein
MNATCNGCGADFEAKRATAQYCSSTCRSRGNRKKPAAVVVPDGPSESGLKQAIIAELIQADRLDTVLGQQALELAGWMASPTASASGVAALSKELRALMTEATKGVAVAADPLDELRARRDRIRSAG